MKPSLLITFVLAWLALLAADASYAQEHGVRATSALQLAAEDEDEDEDEEEEAVNYRDRVREVQQWMNRRDTERKGGATGLDVTPSTEPATPYPRYFRNRDLDQQGYRPPRREVRVQLHAPRYYSRHHYSRRHSSWHRPRYHRGGHHYARHHSFRHIVSGRHHAAAHTRIAHGRHHGYRVHPYAVPLHIGRGHYRGRHHGYSRHHYALPAHTGRGYHHKRHAGYSIHPHVTHARIAHGRHGYGKRHPIHAYVSHPSRHHAYAGSHRYHGHSRWHHATPSIHHTGKQTKHLSQHAIAPIHPHHATRHLATAKTIRHAAHPAVKIVKKNHSKRR